MKVVAEGPGNWYTACIRLDLEPVDLGAIELRAYWRPGASPAERLEGYLAHRMRTREDVARRVTEIVQKMAGPDQDSGLAVAELIPPASKENPAELLGMARALLFLCGACRKGEELLTGDPPTDLRRMLSGELRCAELNSPETYVAPELVDAYCYMGAGFARGMDRLFAAVTRQPLSEHLSRALMLIEPVA